MSLKNFIKDEVDDYLQTVIVKEITEGRNSLKEKTEMIFNRYIIEINYNNRTVEIFDDAFPEEKSCLIKLDLFYESVKNKRS